MHIDAGGKSQFNANRSETTSWRRYNVFIFFAYVVKKICECRHQVDMKEVLVDLVRGKKRNLALGYKPELHQCRTASFYEMSLTSQFASCKYC